MDKAITLGLIILGIVFTLALVIAMAMVFPDRFSNIMPDRLEYGDKKAEWGKDEGSNTNEKSDSTDDNVDISDSGDMEEKDAEVIDTESDEEDVIDLVQDGKYNEAIEKAKNNDREYLTEVERISNAQLLGVQNSISGAFSDLKKTYEENKSSAVVTGCMMGGHYYVGNVDEAVELADKAIDRLDEDDSDPNKRIVLINYSRIKCDIGEAEHAINVLSERVENMSEPYEVSLVYEEIAEAFTHKNEYKNIDVKSIKELSMKYDKNNSSKRFKIAYNYDEESISLGHYNEIIKRGDGNSMTLNNAGVSADNLNLPGKSVRYYKKSKEEGNTLAVANIAKKLINEGFFHKAEEMLSKARNKDEHHENVDSMLGKMSSHKNDEDEVFNEIIDNFGILAKWRSEYGKSILRDDIKYEKMLGTYKANVIPMMNFKNTVELTDGGNEDLNINMGSDKNIKLTRQGRGVRVKFYNDDYYHRSDKKGRGVLVYKNESLLGYFYYDKKDSSILENVQEWRLHKV